MTIPVPKEEKKTIERILTDHAVTAKPDHVKRLSVIMHNTLTFSRGLHWNESLANVFLVRTPEELLEIYRLRSRIYGKLGYDKEFPDAIKGFNYDAYDEKSAILYTKSNGRITGTCRVIFDSDCKLPMDKNFSLEYLRKNNKKLAELSRLVIDRQEPGLGQEPRLLTAGAYWVMKENSMTTLVSVMVHEHFRMYGRFGGFKIEDSLETYGNLGIPFITTSWEIAEISSFFKKVFLAA